MLFIMGNCPDERYRMRCVNQFFLLETCAQQANQHHYRTTEWVHKCIRKFRWTTTAQRKRAKYVQLDVR